jgi:hypothetical protein
MSIEQYFDRLKKDETPMTLLVTNEVTGKECLLHFKVSDTFAGPVGKEMILMSVIRKLFPMTEDELRD